MDIGEESPLIVIEPLEEPKPEFTPEPRPERVREPVKPDREEVPA